MIGVSTPRTPDQRNTLTGVALMAGGSASNQFGAAIGAQAFAAVGPIGVVAIRQLVSAAILLPVARPPFRRFTWAQWWPTLLLGLVFAVMNLFLYSAVERIGLGLAVTLEFLGPLAVALAGTRTVVDGVFALAAAGGVYVLVLPGASTDYLGVGLALAAAVCWAAYILLNRTLGIRLPGLQAPAAAAAVSATAYVPVALVIAFAGRFTGASLLQAAAAGVMCSAIAYAADLLALRRVSSRFFGVFMSIHPVMAALAGLIVLGQRLDAHELIGMAIVVAANVGAVSSAARVRRRDPGPASEG